MLENLKACIRQFFFEIQKNLPGGASGFIDWIATVFFWWAYK